jgi:ketopantoate hydroxymethyltransferase
MSAGRRLLAEVAARRRQRPAEVGLKINLYNGAETEAVLRAVDEAGAADSVECLMVGDSYLMTHLGRPSTRLADTAEQAWFMDVIVALVGEVAAVLQRVRGPRPFLMGDMPDGTTDSPRVALAAAERLLAAGAESIKVEINAPRTLDVLEALAVRGIAVVAHLGYTPQDGARRRHGDTVDDALALFEQARQVRDLGAAGLVLEMVGEPANRALCGSPRAELPIYSVFSGQAPGGGQSLNVWDSVFLPAAGKRYFPPTAELPRAAYPEAYTVPRITEHMAKLMRLTLGGDFPLSPPSALSDADLAALARLDPWDDLDGAIARTGT